MGGRTEWKKQEEADLRNAKLLTEITGLLSHNFRDINTKVIELAKAFKKSQDHLQETRENNKRAADHDDYMKKKAIRNQIFEDSMFAKKVSAAQKANQLQAKERERDRKHYQLIADNRNKNRIETEQVHGENVRFNLKMRQLYKDQSESFSNVMHMMGGSTLRGFAFGGLEKGYNTFRLGSEIVQTNQSLSEARAQQRQFRMSGKSMDPTFEVAWKQINRRIERLTEVRNEQREKLGVFGKYGGAGEEDSKWAKRLEPIMTWAKKNKTGIIISAASIGLLIMSFKKLLSVSPMLQKMLEVMNLAFNLVLRPFGDFIGFILRPIAMMMLSTVMPFFREAYPFLMTLGTAMGEKFAKGDILGGLGLLFEAITPLDVLKWIFGDREGNIEGGIGAVGAALGAGVLGLFSAVVISIRKMTDWVRSFLGLKPTPTNTSSPTGTTNTGNKNPPTSNPSSSTGTNTRNNKPTPTNQAKITEFTGTQSGNNLPRMGILESIKDYFRNWKFNLPKLQVRTGSGGTAFMVSQLLDYYEPFKDAKLEFWKWWRDMDGRNDPSNAWKGYDQYGQGIGVPDYSQEYPFAHNVDSAGNPININVSIGNVENSTDIDYLLKELETSNIRIGGG